MEKSESIKEIDLALSKFQGEVLNGLSIVLQAPYTEGEYVIVLKISSEEDNHGNESKIHKPIVPSNTRDLKDVNDETPEDLITNRQIKYVHVLANEKGIDKRSMKNYLVSLFNKDSTKDLSKKEASYFIEILKTLPGDKHV